MTPAQLALRAYTPADEDAAIAVWQRAWQQAYPQIDFGARLDWWRERWRSELVPACRITVAMAGEAMDIRIPGVDLTHLRDAALSLQRGGVGFYPGSDFVHVDIGRVRRW